MLKKLVVATLVIALICVVGFFAVVGALGGSFAGICIVSDAAQLKGDSNKEKVYNYWVRNGFPSVVAVGMTASTGHESGYSPFRQEMDYPWPTGGYGLVQFTSDQRREVTEYLANVLGDDFTTYYKPEYSGAVTAENGYVPEGVPLAINDQFLGAQLSFLSEYIAKFKPSSIPIRVVRYQALTGLTVPSDATLGEYLVSLKDERTAAIAWTILYEYPGNLYATSLARADTASELYAEIAGQQGGDTSTQQAGGLSGACGGTSVAPLLAGTLAPPLSGDMRISSVYNDTTVPLRRNPHRGIDLIGSYGVQSMAVGVVTFAGYEGPDYGNRVEVDHGNGFVSTYSHLASIDGSVRVGGTVAAGQRVGIMGQTGKSTGDHLHLEVWLDGKHVDPEKFLSDHGMFIPHQR